MGGYVLANDSFMSGWGPAEGRTNVVIFPVASGREADIVRQNLLWRSEMKRVRFRQTKPQDPNSDVLYSLFNAKESPRFYQTDGFHPANRES